MRSGSLSYTVFSAVFVKFFTRSELMLNVAYLYQLNYHNLKIDQLLLLYQILSILMKYKVLKQRSFRNFSLEYQYIVKQTTDENKVIHQ